jgi:hypothetical protein
MDRLSFSTRTKAAGESLVDAGRFFGGGAFGGLHPVCGLLRIADFVMKKNVYN